VFEISNKLNKFWLKGLNSYIYKVDKLNETKVLKND